MAVLIPTAPLDADRAWSEAMRDLRTPFLVDVARVFDLLGRGVGRAVIFAVVAFVLVRARRWLGLLAFVVAETLSSLSSAALKALVGRPRPPEGVIHALGSAFPSGHTTYAGATCVALVLLFSAPGPRRRRWWALAGFGIAAMAWSRTYLEVHWLSDVIAGAMLGIGSSLLVFGIAQTTAAAHAPGEERAAPSSRSRSA